MTIKATCAAIGLSVFFLFSTSFAASNSELEIISKIKVYSTGEIAVWAAGGSWGGSEGCTFDNIIVLPSNNAIPNEFYSEIYALLVSSYLQGKTVSSRLNGCYFLGASSYPVLKTVTSE